MKIVIPVEIELDTYDTVNRVLDCIDNYFNDDIGDYWFHITNEDVIRRNFTIDVLEEALRKVKGV